MSQRTFAGERAFGVGVAFDFVNGGGPPHAVDATSGEGVGQGAGGLQRLRLVQFLPGQLRGRMVKGFAAAAAAATAAHTGWRRVLAGADQAVCVIVLHGAAEALGG